MRHCPPYKDKAEKRLAQWHISPNQAAHLVVDSIGPLAETLPGPGRARSVMRNAYKEPVPLAHYVLRSTFSAHESV